MKAAANRQSVRREEQHKSFSRLDKASGTGIVMLKHQPILAEDYQELQVHRFECQLTILRAFCGRWDYTVRRIYSDSPIVPIPDLPAHATRPAPKSNKQDQSLPDSGLSLA
jgi:hypothetical protein